MRRMPHGRRAWSKTGPRRRGQRVPAAQELFDGWRADLEHRLRAEEDHPVLLSHLAKYRSLLPSLALLFHLIDGVDTGRRGPVSGAAAAQAAAWCEYLAAHARRLYGAVIVAELRKVRKFGPATTGQDVGLGRAPLRVTSAARRR